MRVTNRMLYEAAQAQTASARDRVHQATERFTTGQRVVHPADDPAAASIIVSHRAAIERYETIDRAVERADEELQIADGALQSSSALLARARELAVQFGNDSYSASQRAVAATEIRGISAQLIQLANTDVAGRYIFGGNIDNAPPFSALGVYSGDTAVRQVEVAPSLLLNSSVRADQVFKGVGGGVDIFAVLSTVATAMDANDGSGIRASLTSLESSSDQVATALTEIGSMLQSLSSSRTISMAAKDSVQRVLLSEGEVDTFEAASELANARQALEAVLMASSKSFNLSFLDFMR